MNRSSLVSLFVYLAIIVFATLYCSEVQTNSEKAMDINFKVANIEVTPALRVRLYDKDGNKLNLQRFVFLRSDGIQRNDVIVKEKDSEFIKVYRTDTLGNKIVYLVLKIQ